jgi:Ca-activated chloride channel family protein
MRSAGFVVLCFVLSFGLRAQSDLTLSAAFDRDFYREGVKNELNVEVRVGFPTDKSRERTIQNIALVLDRSGSMAGPRLEAQIKAAQAAIASLDPNDLLSIVTFGSEVEVLQTATRRGEAPNLDRRLAALQTAGGAALYDALSQAAAQLRRNATESVISRLILITDGPPTKGPREKDDFAKLAAALGDEGILISTIGLGEDCEEDVLAEISRQGRGRFRYTPVPEKLGDALQAEVAQPGVIAARDVVLTIEFAARSENAKSYGRFPATVAARKVVFNLPRLVGEGGQSFLASAEFDKSVRNEIRRAVSVKLQWLSPSDGERHELATVLPAYFSSNSLELTKSANVEVTRTGIDALIVDGFQDTIERLDQGDSRGASRALRETRRKARDVNFDLDDAEIAAKIARLDEFLNQISGHPMGANERKALRAGAFNRFDSPFPRPAKDQ